MGFQVKLSVRIPESDTLREDYGPGVYGPLRSELIEHNLAAKLLSQLRGSRSTAHIKVSGSRRNLLAWLRKAYERADLWADDRGLDEVIGSMEHYSGANG